MKSTLHFGGGRMAFFFVVDIMKYRSRDQKKNSEKCLQWGKNQKKFLAASKGVGLKNDRFGIEFPIHFFCIFSITLRYRLVFVLLVVILFE